MTKLSPKLQGYLDEIDSDDVRSVIIASRDCLNDAAVEQWALAYLIKQRQYEEARKALGELRVQVQKMGVRG